MAYDYKRLCNELLSYLYQCNWPDGKRFYALVERTQAALAEPVPLDTLENRLGDALGLAISMIRKPETIDNKTMAQIEAPFKEWCDALVDGGLLND